MQDYNRSEELKEINTSPHVWRDKAITTDEVYPLQGMFLGFRNTPILGRDSQITGWEPTRAIFKRDDNVFVRVNVSQSLSDLLEDEDIEVGDYFAVAYCHFSEHWRILKNPHPLEAHCPHCGRGYEREVWALR
jgi:hypothetical protein